MPAPDLICFSILFPGLEWWQLFRLREPGSLSWELTGEFPDVNRPAPGCSERDKFLVDRGAANGTRLVFSLLRLET